MTKADPSKLTRRERQIMDIIYSLGEATAAQVHERLPEPPSYSAVRATLRKLERKGQVKHRQDGPRYVFRPILPHRQARSRAVDRLVETFFDGSMAQAISGLLGMSRRDLTSQELDELAKAIELARKEEK